MAFPIKHILSSLGLAVCMVLYGIGVWNGNSAFTTGELFTSVSQEISSSYPLFAAAGMIAGILARIITPLATGTNGKWNVAFIICGATIPTIIAIGGLWDKSPLLFYLMALSTGWTFSCASFFWVTYISSNSLPSNIVLPLALLLGAAGKAACSFTPQIPAPLLIGWLTLISALLILPCRKEGSSSPSDNQRRSTLAALAQDYFKTFEKFADVLICIIALQIIAPSINYLGLMDALEPKSQSLIVCLAQLSAAVLSFLFLSLSTRYPHSTRFFQYVTPCLVLALFFVPFAGYEYTLVMLFVGSCLYFTTADALFRSDAIHFPLGRSVPFESFYAIGYLILAGTSLLMENLMPNILSTSSSAELLTVFAVFFCVYILSMAFMVARKRKDGKPSPAAETETERAPKNNEQPKTDPHAAIPHNSDEAVAIVKEKNNLSEREAEILSLILRGKNVPSIAEALTISQNTVRSHVKRIYRATDVHTRQDLINYCEKTIEPKQPWEG